LRYRLRLEVDAEANLTFGHAVLREHVSAHSELLGDGILSADLAEIANVLDARDRTELGSHDSATNFELLVQGGYRNGFDSDLKAGQASLALGAHTLLGAKTDGYVLARATALVDDARDADKWGYEAEAGVRHLLTEKLEVRGAVVATELRSISSVKDVRYFGKVGAEYAITEQFRVGADVLAKDGATEGQVGFRVYF
jgi:hypothetical protein